jgi:hypothetical protein
MMQDVSALIGISAALAIGAASPGPGFVMVALGMKLVSSARAWLRGAF